MSAYEPACLSLPDITVKLYSQRVHESLLFFSCEQALNAIPSLLVFVEICFISLMGQFIGHGIPLPWYPFEFDIPILLEQVHHGSIQRKYVL